MGLFADLQRRIPDKWYFRRLLPALVFVMLAAVGCGQLGQRHWADVGLARDRIAAALQVTGGTAAASLVLLAVGAAVCALAVPLAAAGVDTLASGAWPWWLTPLGRRLLAMRDRRWASPDDLGKDAVRARAAGREFRAARLDARRTGASPDRPQGFTWSADRFAEARQSVRDATKLDISVEWPRLLLVVPENVQAALREARDAYDAACEAIVWSLAVAVLGVWWWPALVAGLAMWLVSWRRLRRSVIGLCDMTAWVFTRYEKELPAAGALARPRAWALDGHARSVQKKNFKIFFYLNGPWLLIRPPAEPVRCVMMEAGPRHFGRWRSSRRRLRTWLPGAPSAEDLGWRACSAS